MTFERRRTGIGSGAVADGEGATEVNGDVGCDADSTGWKVDGLLSGLLSVDEEEDLKRLLNEKGLEVTVVGVGLGLMVVVVAGRIFSLLKWSLDGVPAETVLDLGWPVRVEFELLG